MVSAKRILTRFRVDLVAGAITWCGMLAMAHPDRLVDLVGREHIGQKLAFELGVYTAFIATSFLAMRWVVRLARTTRRISWNPAHLGVQGVLAAEFALVLPLALLLIGTVVQIALISQAYVVAHYAAFAAARSAMVNVDDAIQPALGNVNHDPVKAAACTVLAALSPPEVSSGYAQRAKDLDVLLIAQNSAWDGGRYSARYKYAEAATVVKTEFGTGKVEQYARSLQPMFPRLEHILEPKVTWDGGSPQGGNFPAPEGLQNVLPTEYNFPLFEGAALDVPPLPAWTLPPITLPIPIDALTGGLISTINGLLNKAIKMAVGAGWTVYDKVTSVENVNVDPFSPQEIEVRLEYSFRLAIPSLFNWVPAITVAAPSASTLTSGRAFVLKFHEESRVGYGPNGDALGHPDYLGVRLQSTGPRRRLGGLFPYVLDVDALMTGGQVGAWNTPLYWTPQIPMPTPTKDEPAKAKK